MKSSHVIRTASFATEAAKLIIESIQLALSRQNRFLLGLCGGKTPEPIYAELARRGQSLDWSRIFITFGDERCVAPDDPQSNYSMAKRSLLDAIKIPAGNVLRMQGEIDPAEAARMYEKELRSLPSNSKDGIIRHDLLLLGLGDDGHTASLFPGTAALSVTDRLVAANHVDKLDADRITFTYPLIDASRNIFFLVNDPRKDPIANKILTGDMSYPAARVSAEESLTWIIGM